MSQEEIDKFTKILQEKPRHVVVRMKRAEQYMKKKFYLQCLKDCRIVLALEEHNVRCLIYSAACHLAMNQKEEAIKCLTEAQSYSKDDEFKYALGDIKEWETAVFFEITDPDFLPDDKRCKNSYKKPKKEPSWNDKMKDLYKNANPFC